MPLLPLDIPPGIHANGTAIQSAGRWRDANLVRWANGRMGPVGGWTDRVQVGSEAPRASFAWRALNGDHWFAAATSSNVYAVNADNTVTDITPAGLITGTGSASVSTGFGMGTFGSGYYGVSRADYGTYDEATTWTLDAWGEEMIACSSTDGRLWSWDLNPANNLVVIPNAPTSCLSALVTDERFLMAFGAGGDPRRVDWSDRENREVWNDLPENEAGNYHLQTPGQIMCSLKVPGRTLILTDHDAHAVTYLGPPFVHGFERVGDACGVISRKAAVVAGGMAYWMGPRGFFRSDGQAVEALSCDIIDTIFNGLNSAQISKCWAMSLAEHGEVWFFYAQGNEIDRYAAYNYRENHWARGRVSRTTGFDRGVFRSPMMFKASGMAVDHEIGLNMDGLVPFAQTGPIQLGAGDQVMAVTDLLPDEATTGDLTATFRARFEPNGVERTYGPYSLAARTNLRFSGRQIALRVTGARLADWRWGVPRIEAVAVGRR